MISNALLLYLEAFSQTREKRNWIVLIILLIPILLIGTSIFGYFSKTFHLEFYKSILLICGGIWLVCAFIRRITGDKINHINRTKDENEIKIDIETMIPLDELLKLEKVLRFIFNCGLIVVMFDLAYLSYFHFLS